MIIIKLTSNEKFIYPTISDINPEYLDKIQYLNCMDCNVSQLPFLPNLEELDCANNKITTIHPYPKLKKLRCEKNDIKSLPSFPLLKKLYCGVNKLEYLPDYPNLTTLYCERNKITRLGKYPLLIYLWCDLNKLENLNDDYQLINTISCSYNNLTEIPYYPDLMFINCSNNKIIKIEEYPFLNHLYCYKNRLTQLSNYPFMKELDCSDNLITTIPNILEWNDLSEFYYSGNPVEYIPPNIVRRLEQIRNRFINMNGRNIFNDTQNVHNHNIQKSISDSIQNIISDKPDINFDTMINEIIHNEDGMNDATKQILTEFVENTEVHSVLGITFKELLLSVWSIIRRKPQEARRYVIEILNIEMTDSVCKCFTGRMSRLINCLNGIDERVSITISDNEQIGNIIVSIMKKLQEKSEYTIELHRELVEKELIERGFSNDIIQIWINSIE
jgi:hypothetical protein